MQGKQCNNSSAAENRSQNQQIFCFKFLCRRSMIMQHKFCTFTQKKYHKYLQALADSVSISRPVQSNPWIHNSQQMVILREQAKGIEQSTNLTTLAKQKQNQKKCFQSRGIAKLNVFLRLKIPCTMITIHYLNKIITFATQSLPQSRTQHLSSMLFSIYKIHCTMITIHYLIKIKTLATHHKAVHGI